MQFLTLLHGVPATDYESFIEAERKAWVIPV